MVGKKSQFNHQSLLSSKPPPASTSLHYIKYVSQELIKANTIYVDANPQTAARFHQEGRGEREGEVKEGFLLSIIPHQRCPAINVAAVWFGVPTETTSAIKYKRTWRKESVQSKSHHPAAAASTDPRCFVIDDPWHRTVKVQFPGKAAAVCVECLSDELRDNQAGESTKPPAG